MCASVSECACVRVCSSVCVRSCVRVRSFGVSVRVCVCVCACVCVRWLRERRKNVYSDLPGFCGSVLYAECLPRVHIDY